MRISFMAAQVSSRTVRERSEPRVGWGPDGSAGGAGRRVPPRLLVDRPRLLAQTRGMRQSDVGAGAVGGTVDYRRWGAAVRANGRPVWALLLAALAACGGPIGVRTDDVKPDPREQTDASTEQDPRF